MIGQLPRHDAFDNDRELPSTPFEPALGNVGAHAAVQDPGPAYRSAPQDRGRGTDY
jgi:hypothetical protein